MFRYRPSVARALLLAALLLAGQLLLLQHEAEVELHAGGDSCQWCLTHSPLAGALPSAALSLPAPTAAAVVADARHETPARFTLPGYHSRAPPVLSA